MDACDSTICAPPARNRPISLPALRRRVWSKVPNSLVRLGPWRVRITDGPNAYMQFKDVFIHGIYRFRSQVPDPLIIDGGSNMGISILGFKHDHPASRIIGFEPDPAIAQLLQENLERNDASAGVKLIVAGLGAQEGAAGFVPDGSASGRIDGAAPGQTIQVVRLSAYLREPVDFLKLNIEGEELPVLHDCAAAGVLHNVRQMVVEYHGWAQGPQRLGELLNLLDSQGFRYLMHDFDAETCTITKPPFRLRPRADWFCLVHAQRPQ